MLRDGKRVAADGDAGQREKSVRSANAGVVDRRRQLQATPNSLKTQRPALACAGRVRLEGCCSIHLSYGRRVRLAI